MLVYPSVTLYTFASGKWQDQSVYILVCPDHDYGFIEKQCNARPHTTGMGQGGWYSLLVGSLLDLWSGNCYLKGHMNYFFRGLVAPFMYGNVDICLW